MDRVLEKSPANGKIDLSTVSNEFKTTKGSHAFTFRQTSSKKCRLRIESKAE